MNDNLYVALMAGGSGTRFWPYSRRDKPKQFLDILQTGKTLLQSTYERFLPLCPKENIWVITTPLQAKWVVEQLGLDHTQLLVEPEGKNTAPCIAYACYKIASINPRAVVAVSPADHLVLNEDKFRDTVKRAVDSAAAQDRLITLGIFPSRPETGFGYIQFEPSDKPLRRVKRFVEKPSEDAAKRFIEQGDVVWNSGIFIWGVEAVRKAFSKFAPAMHAAFAPCMEAFGSPDEEALVRKAYEQVEAISIDYGIMEKADNVYVWLSDFPWSDLGSWAALHEVMDKDRNHNRIEANAVTYDTKNSIVRGDRRKLMVVQGLKNYLVGDFGDVIIVCQKDKEALFRRFIADLKDNPDLENYL